MANPYGILTKEEARRKRAAEMTHTESFGQGGEVNGVPWGQIKSRMDRGWSYTDAISVPPSSWDEIAGQTVGGFIESQNPYDVAAMSQIPGISDIAGLYSDIKRLYENPKDRTVFGYSMAALGALPMLPSGMGLTVGGKLARNAGESERYIMREGLPDYGEYSIPSRLAIDHPDLEANYSDLPQFRAVSEGLGEGSFNQQANMIDINALADNPKSTSIHELQRNGGRSSSTPFEDFTKTIKKKYGLESFSAYERGNDITVIMLEVPKQKRKQGLGSKAMQDLVDYADITGKRIKLSPALKDEIHGTTSRTRLVRFYKRFGFVENKGRNKDFAISEGMYRDPK